MTVPTSYLTKHINMLLREAEQRVDDLTTAVVHVSYTTSSEVKVTKNNITPVETLYNEGPRGSQNLFSYFGVFFFFHIFHYYWAKENCLLY